LDFRFTEFSEVALVPAEYPDGRYDQDHTQHELERSRWDLSDEEAPHYGPDHRPKVRDWMNSNSWLVNIIVCGVFIALIVL